MDEPTSALDKNAEKMFIQSLKNLRGTVTLILISHKDQILSSCDKVIKINQSNISINLN